MHVSSKSPEILPLQTDSSSRQASVAGVVVVGNRIKVRWREVPQCHPLRVSCEGTVWPCLVTVRFNCQR